MTKIIDVHTGEVKTSKGDTILRSAAIGSCVAVIAYDPTKKIGGLAHVMLPGKSPNRNGKNRRKYATDAIDVLLKEMLSLGANKIDIEVSIVGGGNVLKKENATTYKKNIDSVIKNVERLGLKLTAVEVGGTERRSASIDVENGVVSYSKGDSGQKTLKISGR